MKNLLLYLTIVLLVAMIPAKAQTYTDAIDSIFSHVSRADATTGILYERVLSFGNLTKYDSRIAFPDTSNFSHLLRAYSEIYRAAFQPMPMMMQMDSLKQRIENDTSHIQIGILHFDFNTFDTSVFRQKLYFDSDSIIREDVSNINSLYEKNSLLVASPLIHVLTKRNAAFKINSRYYFDNTLNKIRVFSVDFDDGVGFRQVELNDVLQVIYHQDGMKTIRFMMTLKNGDVMYAYATLEVRTEETLERYNGPLYFDDYVGNNAIEARITPPNPYDGGNFTKSKGEVRIYYSNSEKILRKPLLIIDGFDPMDERKFDSCTVDGKKSLWEMLFYDDEFGQRLHLGLRLLDMGYDIVMLNFPEGGTYIEQNAMVCVEVLNRLNEMLIQNGSNEQIVVVGPSMGGQIARYALTYMERNPNENTNYGKHNTRLWISYDSPHQGANIAMGAQELIKFFARENSESNISNIWNKTLCCPAAKQMLKHHADTSANSLFVSYYDNLHNLNPATSGYPSMSRNISVANGSFNNILNGTDHQIAFQGTFFAPTNLIINPISGLHLPFALVDVKIRNVKDSGNGEVLRLDFFLATTIGPIYFFIHRKFNNDSGNNSPDVAPGGTYDTYDQVESALKNTPVVGGLTAISNNQRIHCFMPITSTLDISGNMNYNTDISSRDLIAEGLTHFDSYAGVMDTNLYHVTFNYQLVYYLLNEIETYIQGPREVRQCTHPSYTMHLPLNANATVTWLSSPNIHVETGNDPYTVTITPLEEGEGWISANVSTLNHNKRLANYPIHILPYNDNTIPTVYSTTITGQSMTISTDTQILDTFCIESGKTLTITGTLYCAPKTRLVVRPGGKLVIDGGTLTSACPGVMWQGIEVVGDRTKRQLTQYQGKVELKNGARVENALCAVRMGLREDTLVFATAGGIISASNSIFKNNRQSVVVNSYAYTALSGSIANYNATFSRCTFTVDNSNLFAANNTNFFEHVRLWDVKGVDFDGCTFSNSTNNLYGNGRGIYAEDAGISVNTYCPPQPTPVCECPESDATYSYFSGFTTAVEVNTTGNPYAVRIDGSRFDNNGTGVRINGNQFATVTRCRFNLDQHPGHVYGNTGLELEGCSGYTVEENHFERTTYPSGPNLIENSIGIGVSNSGISDNSIYRNNFLNLTHGISVLGENGHNKFGTGLQMTCNYFNGNKYDVYLTFGASVCYHQGTSTKGADNEFHNTSNSVKNFHNPGLFNVNYYFYSGDVNFNPVYHTGLNPTTISSVNNCLSTLCDNNNGGGIYLPLSGFASQVSAYIVALSGTDDDGLVGENDYSLLQTMHQPLSEAYYNAVRTLMSDTVLDLNELEQWHSAAQPIADPYSLTETRFMEGYAEIFAGNAETDAEMANYADFHALKLALRGDNTDNDNNDNADNQDNNNSQNSPKINWYALTPAQIAQLQTIAERNTGRASVMAKGVLCFFHGICYEDEWDNAGAFDTPQQGDDTAGIRAKRTATDNPDDAALSVYPNPTDDVLFIELRGGAEIANVLLYDLQGRMINSPNSFNSPMLNVKSIPSGLYILRVTDVDGREYHRKIVKK